MALEPLIKPGDSKRERAFDSALSLLTPSGGDIETVPAKPLERHTALPMADIGRFDLARTHNIDLHALECLEVLLRERSVTRAAERLGMSQSSMSETLARLRERFDDPLLVRGREGMTPTVFAEAILVDVRATIEGLHALLDRGREFDPATTAQRFRITTSDYTQLLLMPALCGCLREEAPQCGVDVLPVNISRLEQALDTGEVDLAIAYHPDPPSSLRRSPLFRDAYVCVASREHPAATRPLSPAGFAALRHVSVAPSGLAYFSSAVDSALEAAGLTRRVDVSSPHFLLAAHLVSQSELVLALPRQAASVLAKFFPLAIFEIPLSLRPVEIAMYWHERCHSSKAQEWLRSKVRDALLLDSRPVSD